MHGLRLPCHLSTLPEPTRRAWEFLARGFAAAARIGPSRASAMQAAGAVAYLEKTCSLETVVAAIRNCLLPRRMVRPEAPLG